MFKNIAEDDYNFEEFGEVLSSPESQRVVEDFDSAQDEEYDDDEYMKEPSPAQHQAPKIGGMKLPLGNLAGGGEQPKKPVVGGLNLGGLANNQDGGEEESKAPVPPVKGLGGMKMPGL